MTPTGKNILVEPKPREKIINGIIIPDNATPPAQEWGVVVDGNGIIDNGSRVLYFGRKLFSQGETKVLPIKKILYWHGI